MAVVSLSTQGRNVECHLSIRALPLEMTPPSEPPYARSFVNLMCIAATRGRLALMALLQEEHRFTITRLSKSHQCGEIDGGEHCAGDTMPAVVSLGSTSLPGPLGCRWVYIIGNNLKEHSHVIIGRFCQI